MIVVIADDLTGASDAAVQFARCGLRTRVVFDVDSPPGEVEALAIDTDSRALTAEEAYARVRGAVERMICAQTIYKKIDSTLRGNLGAEIDAVMDALALPLAIVAPAFPHQGRTTRAAMQLVHGTPVHLTEAARDPRAPVVESNVSRLLAATSRRSVAAVPIGTVRAGAGAIRHVVEQYVRDGASILVCDAESDTDLRTIASSYADRGDVLWVGSAGLAAHLPMHSSAPNAAPLPVAHGRNVRRPDRPASHARAPIVLVCGTLAEATARQLRAVENVERVEVNGAALIHATERDQEIERCSGAVSAALAAGRDCALVTSDRRPDAEGQVAHVLGAIVAAVLQSQSIGGLILTGGETARAVCRAIGATGIDIISEVEPGVPLGHLSGPLELPVVTKAGAFGSDNVFVNALRQLKGAHHP